MFAALQWNDIDASIWISMYLTSAILALIAYKEICLPCMVAWTILVALFATYLLIGVATGTATLIENNAYTDIFFAMDDSKPHIEQTREVLGLLIILFHCTYTLINICIKKRKL